MHFHGMHDDQAEEKAEKTGATGKPRLFNHLCSNNELPYGLQHYHRSIVVV